ncbi:MAG: hypothetical protein IPN32_07865 [Deltaproteobacteria bacterium]|nr:hypothetical protein [Deltaproteobacteria bacterium]
MFKLWRFLHETGFINAVVSDDRMPRGFRHINYADDPELASASRWNDIQPVAWEIHPVFRQFLIDEQTASAADMGLSPEELRRQRRPSKT